ncbi:MAG: protein O-GlcNAcase [Bacteroidales bacterium]|nr:protein O-GlcNAcase [Bacteroidales bacterium]
MRRTFFIAALALLCPVLCPAAGYDIYPVPHTQVCSAQKASFSGEVVIVRDASIDEATFNRAVQVLSERGLKTSTAPVEVKGKSNLILGVNAENGMADRYAGRMGLSREVFYLDGKFDRHILSLAADRNGLAQVLVLGENTDAVFCGLASLEQILDGGVDGLECVDIHDYADIRNRGIIEGYYGMPYSAAVTKDLFRFMARYKLNTYMYGAKSDPYHSEFWSEPYPDEITPEQERIGYLSKAMMKDITGAAHAAKVNFIWAIHPGTAFCNPADADVNSRIMSKFESMYELGVRQFGVFVDDVGVPSDESVLKLGADRLTDLQSRLDSRWNAAGTAPEDTVKPLHYVPQLYAYSWVPRRTARKFFESLRPTPAKIDIYITGRAVWTVPNNEDLALVKEFLGRPVSWWWNYPCNDNDMNKVFTMDMYSNFRDESHIEPLSRMEPLNGAGTLIINPMQQGELSKVSLFSVADYAWNNAAFNNEQSFAAAIPAVFGRERAEAYATIAPYLRYFDEDVLSIDVRNYRASVREGHPRPAALVGKLSGVIAVCGEIKALETSSCESDRLMWEDIRPYVLKLEALSREAVTLLSGGEPSDIDFDNDPAFKLTLIMGMGKDITLSTITAEPAARVLTPLVKELREAR